MNQSVLQEIIDVHLAQDWRQFSSQFQAPCKISVESVVAMLRAPKIPATLVLDFPASNNNTILSILSKIIRKHSEISSLTFMGLDVSDQVFFDFVSVCESRNITTLAFSRCKLNSLKLFKLFIVLSERKSQISLTLDGVNLGTKDQCELLEVLRRENFNFSELCLHGVTSLPRDNFLKVLHSIPYCLKKLHLSLVTDSINSNYDFLCDIISYTESYLEELEFGFVSWFSLTFSRNLYFKLKKHQGILQKLVIKVIGPCTGEEILGVKSLVIPSTNFSLHSLTFQVYDQLESTVPVTQVELQNKKLFRKSRQLAFLLLSRRNHARPIRRLSPSVVQTLLGFLFH